MKAWHAKAPKLPEPPEQVPETPQAVPPPFAADERDIGEATTPGEPTLEQDETQPSFAPSVYRPDG